MKKVDVNTPFSNFLQRYQEEMKGRESQKKFLNQQYESDDVKKEKNTLLLLIRGI
ncbi:unnamed protein product [Paramecium primaurelia]|uniref:Uncharacterized protein n=1 Tax=Paramecium primaurelia TaxID=5886 RepID=A0A8S1ML56_PARPR|nr:unnamed protein product [Paramecium primaurelia]